MTSSSPTNPTFFATRADFRAWLEKHHDTAAELWIGFSKKGSSRATITSREAVEEAVCFGWIDSVRKPIDAEAYTNRFTPRKPRSRWSAINIKRLERLRAEGRMHPAGLATFDRRAKNPEELSPRERVAGRRSPGRAPSGPSTAP
jgi:uncharacterized protein YdeI (YjbR/CyaY-like superfamily)